MLCSKPSRLATSSGWFSSGPDQLSARQTTSGAAAARVSSIPACRSRQRPYRPQTFQVTIRIVVSITGP